MKSNKGLFFFSFFCPFFYYYWCKIQVRKNHMHSENVCREDKISIRRVGGVRFKLGDTERHSTPPRAEPEWWLSGVRLMSGRRWRVIQSPAAGVLWVGTTSHKTLLSRDLFSSSSSFPEQSEQEWVIILMFCFVCSHQSSKRKHWISTPTDKLFSFPFCPSSEVKWLSCATQHWNHTDVVILSILAKQTT